jgi:hypothetical protein
MYLTADAQRRAELVAPKMSQTQYGDLDSSTNIARPLHCGVRVVSLKSFPELAAFCFFPSIYRNE